MPQCAALVIVSTQAEPHAIKPVPHVAEQADAEQNGAAVVQAAAHAPQLFGSDVRSTQTPLQEVCPGEQPGGLLGP